MFDLKEKILEFKIDESRLESDDVEDDDDLIEFLQSMLTIDPTKRATIIDLFSDPWLTRNSTELIDLF